MLLGCAFKLGGLPSMSHAWYLEHMNLCKNMETTCLMAHGIGQPNFHAMHFVSNDEETLHGHRMKEHDVHKIESKREIVYL